jgi:hypothetical protein
VLNDSRANAIGEPSSRHSTQSDRSNTGMPPATEIETQREYRRIVIAIDGPRDLGLVPHAAELARTHHAVLEIVCGSPRISPFVYANPFAYATVVGVALASEAVRKSREQLVQRALRQVGMDISVRARVIEGNASRAVVQGLDADYDLAVVGRDGRRFQRFARRSGGAVLCLQHTGQLSDGATTKSEPAPGSD